MSLVIVSNRLPVSVKKTDGKLEFYPSVGGLATGLANYTERRGTKWIGWPGVASDSLTEAEKQQITKRLAKQHCYPVFLTQEQIDTYYSGFSNSVLWPLFHDLALQPHTKRQWEAYQAVNKLFADEVLRLSSPGSTIWVHDYQLLLVPQLINQARRDDRVGFFLHIPFPEAGLLRQIREARSLLNGVLGADLVGFHTRSYAQNFLDACDDLLGTGKVQDFVVVDGRTVRIRDFPMGIDYDHFERALAQPNSMRALGSLRKRYRGKKVILTVDRLDPTKGLLERLKAYRKLLRENPDLHGKVVMVMIVAPSRTDIREYQQLKEKLDKLLAEIEKEFASDSWQPVDFKYESVPLGVVMLYYQLADVAFITPLKDGMNLVAKEYFASKPHGAGVLVLSETAGAAEELRDAIQVNPRRPDSLVDGLKRAFAMPKRELRTRATRMQQHIAQFTVQHWAADFINTLQRPYYVKPRTLSLTPHRTTALLSSYHQARKRLLLLDYDGTLREFVKNPETAKPSGQIMRLLKRLGTNPENEVVLVSGRSRENMAEWFGDLPIALAAEHGAFFRRKGGRNWHRNINTDTNWHRPVQDIFNRYTKAAPGSFVEEKNAALVWHYRAATPYYAQKSLVTIRRLLKPLLKEHKLIAKDGKKALEVHSNEISKGRAIQEWLIHDHDFVLAIGDDITDEDMFTSLPPAAYSVKVGHGPTAARYRVKDVQETLGLLSKF